LAGCDERRAVRAHVVHCTEEISQDRLADCAERMVLALDDRLLAVSCHDQIYAMVALKWCDVNLVPEVTKPLSDPRFKSFRHQPE